MRRRALRALIYLLWLVGGAGPSVAFAQPFASQVEAARGRLKLFTTATLPSPCAQGQLVWDLTASTVKVCTDGTNWAVSGGSVTSGTLTLNTVPKALSASSIGDSTITDDGTTVTCNVRTVMLASITGSSLTSNFFSVTATTPSSLSGNTFGTADFITGAGSSNLGAILGSRITWLKAGYTGPSTTVGTWSLNSSAGTGASYLGGDTSVLGNIGHLGQASSSTAGANIGVMGFSSNAGSGNSVGLVGFSDSGAVSVGVIGVVNGGTQRNGAYFGFNTAAPNREAGLLVDNGSRAAPIAVFRDNGSAAPTSAATAGWEVLDGGIPRADLGILTSATMAAETQAYALGSLLSSYTWTNAQVVALGATTTGDITVATLPAKTVVKRALVVILTADTSANALTVSCGDATVGTPFTNYVLPGDAKAAANTVYGDAISGAETGASLFDATAKWNPGFLPSYTATTLVTCHFIKTTTNLSTVLTSTGRVILETALLP